MDRSDEFHPGERDVEHVRSRERPRGETRPPETTDDSSIEQDPEAAKRRVRIRRDDTKAPAADPPAHLRDHS
jgi:hypothetical protein